MSETGREAGHEGIDEGGAAQATAPVSPPRPLAAYLGVGCLTGAAGLAGGGMLAVLVAKVVGAATQCVPTENGAPCNWDMYWTWGARVGVILLPAMALWRMWRSDRKHHSARNSQ